MSHLTDAARALFTAPDPQLSKTAPELRSFPDPHHQDTSRYAVAKRNLHTILLQSKKPSATCLIATDLPLRR